MLPLSGFLHHGWYEQGKGMMTDAELVKIGVQTASPPLRSMYHYWSLFSRFTDETGEPVRDLEYPLAESMH